MKILYYGFDNEDLQREVAGYVEKYKWLVPPWITMLVVRMGNSDDACAAAKAELVPAYMKHVVSVLPNFVDDRQPQREGYIVHELAHAVVNEQHNLAMDIVEQFVKDPDARKLLYDQVRERTEKATCWIEHLAQTGGS